MTRKDALAMIRAFREQTGVSVVSIDRTVNGSVTFSVRAAARSVKQAGIKAQEVFDGLAKRYAPSTQINKGEK